MVIHEEPSSNASITIYDAVLPIILEKLETPVSTDELAKSLNVSKTQLNKWLKRAVENGCIRKLSRPVRYEIQKKEKTQKSCTRQLFRCAP